MEKVKPKILFTVCARAGSKRLPGKNIKDFHGIPLIMWTIYQILNFRNANIDNYNIDICICTDIDKDIDGSLITQYITNPILCSFFTIIDRPQELSGDDVPKVDVIRYVYNATKDNNYDFVIDLDVTNPCRTIEDIQNCVDLFMEKRPVTLFSVVKSRKTLWFNQISKCKHYNEIESFVVPVDKTWKKGYYEIENYDLNASIYIYSIDFLSKGICSSPIQTNSLIYEMPEWTAFDIDTQTDFDIAEMLFKKHILDKGE